MKLSEHFTLAEFTDSDYALRHGIVNMPSPNILGNLKQTADSMEKVRTLLNAPIDISSGYRSPTLNLSIGGSKTSAHCLGFAVDFKAKQFGTPLDIVRKIKSSGIQYDQLIFEGSWVHISFSPPLRQQTLSAIFDARGRVTYKAFE